MLGESIAFIGPLSDLPLSPNEIYKVVMEIKQGILVRLEMASVLDNSVFTRPVYGWWHVHRWTIQRWWVVNWWTWINRRLVYWRSWAINGWWIVQWRLVFVNRFLINWGMSVSKCLMNRWWSVFGEFVHWWWNVNGCFIHRSRWRGVNGRFT